MKTKPYALTKPCTLCPFRTDVKPYLTRARAEEIANSLVRSEFPCHETTGAKAGETRPEEEHMHCAGALIVLERMESPSQMMRISERIGLYDPTKLDMEADVFECLDDFIEAQPKRRKKS